MNNNTRIHQWCIVYRLRIYIESVGNFNEKQIGKERESERERVRERERERESKRNHSPPPPRGN